MKINNKHKKLINEDTIIAIDPASGATSMPGYAVYNKGFIIGSGVIKINSKGTIAQRLNELCACCNKLLYTYYPKLLIIERIRGQRSHNSLKWACGVIVAAFGLPIIEVPTTVWRKYHKNHIKGDREDAIAIGSTVIILSKEEI